MRLLRALSRNARLFWLPLVGLPLLFLAACGEPGGTAAESGTLVTISIGEPGSQSRAAAATTPAAGRRGARSIPASVRALRITVQGPGMTEIVNRVAAEVPDRISATFSVPQGPARTFLVEALDEGGEVRYVGTATVDVFGATLQLPIRMQLAATNSFFQRWHWRNPVSSGSDLHGIAHGNGVFVAVGAAGTVLTSRDGGGTWTPRNPQNEARLESVAYGGGTFVAVADSGEILASSDDGATWTLGRPVPTPLTDIAYGNGRFLAVGEAGTVLTSADGGRTWAPTGNFPQTARLNAVAFGGSAFYAIAGNGASARLFASGDNGATWQAPTAALAPGRDPAEILVASDSTGIAFGDGRVLVADGDGNVVSFDPSTGSAFATNTCSRLRSLAFRDGEFAGVGDDGVLTISTDGGASWTRKDLGVTRPLRRCAFGNGPVAAVGERGVIVTSAAQGSHVRWSDPLEDLLPGSVADSFAVAASAEPNGSICPSGAVRADEGANLTFEIRPAADYRIADVRIDGTSVGPLTAYVFPDLTADHTISATFVHADYTLTASAGPNGAVAPSGAVLVPPGGSQTFFISPVAGYHVADVQVDGMSVGAVTSYTFANVRANHAITASFAPNPLLTITATAGPGGSIAPSGAVDVLTGAGQSFSITPAAGHHIADVLVDGVSVGPVTSYTFPPVTLSHSISASFAPDLFIVTASAGSGGSIAPSGAVAVPSGADQTFAIAPIGGFHVADVLVDGTSVGAVSSYTFTNTSSNHTIAASFAVDRFTLTGSAGPNGSISPTSLTVTSGETRAFTITPNRGFLVLDVRVDGSSVGAVTSYTFTNVTANHTISATFIEGFLIAASAPIGGGSITPSGTVTVPRGGSQTFSLQADPGYFLLELIVDDVSVAPQSTYTFSNVTQNHRIDAMFYSVPMRVAAGSVASASPAAQAPAAAPTVSLASIPASGVRVGPLGFGDGIFVGGIFDPRTGLGALVRSLNSGAAWTASATPPSGQVGELSGFAYGEGVFTAVGPLSPTGRGTLYASADGAATWADRGAGVVDDLNGVAFGDGAFIAVSNNGGAYRSVDGARSWSRTPVAAGGALHGIAFGNGLFVAVGRAGTAGAVFTSGDAGATWAPVSGFAPSPLRYVAYGDGAFVAVDAAGQVFSSPNGRTWAQAAPLDLGNATACALASGGGAVLALDTAGKIHSSPDNGASWSTSLFRSPNLLTSLAFGDGTFLAGGSGSSVLQSNPL